MKRWLVFLVVGVLGSSGCSKSPSAPSQPTIAQVSGVWLGSVRLSSATGGDCVGPTLSGAVGSVSNYSLQITQAGSALTATATNTSSGATTNYTGTAGASTVALNATFSSTARLFGIRCSNGALRDMTLNTGTITATVTGNTGSGTEGESYNVFVAGTSTSIGILTVNSTFTMSR